MLASADDALPARPVLATTLIVSLAILVRLVIGCGSYSGKLSAQPAVIKRCTMR